MKGQRLVSVGAGIIVLGTVGFFLVRDWEPAPPRPAPAASTSTATSASASAAHKTP